MRRCHRVGWNCLVFAYHKRAYFSIFRICPLIGHGLGKSRWQYSGTLCSKDQEYCIEVRLGNRMFGLPPAAYEKTDLKPETNRNWVNLLWATDELLTKGIRETTSFKSFSALLRIYCLTVFLLHAHTIVLAVLTLWQSQKIFHNFIDS